MTSARFTNEDHTFGEFIRANGEVTNGPLPPNAGDIRAEYDAWIAAGNEPEPYVEPTAPVPEEIADWQFWGQLRAMGVVTPEEAMAAIGNGAIPAIINDAIEALPITSEQKMDIREQVMGAVNFRRHNAQTEFLRQMMGWSEEATDALWSAASQRGA